MCTYTSSGFIFSKRNSMLSRYRKINLSLLKNGLVRNVSIAGGVIGVIAIVILSIMMAMPSYFSLMTIDISQLPHESLSISNNATMRFNETGLPHRYQVGLVKVAKEKWVRDLPPPDSVARKIIEYENGDYIIREFEYVAYPAGTSEVKSIDTNRSLITGEAFHVVAEMNNDLGGKPYKINRQLSTIAKADRGILKHSTKRFSQALIASFAFLVVGIISFACYNIDKWSISLYAVGSSILSFFLSTAIIFAALANMVSVYGKYAEELKLLAPAILVESPTKDSPTRCILYVVAILNLILLLGSLVVPIKYFVSFKSYKSSTPGNKCLSTAQP